MCFSVRPSSYFLINVKILLLILFKDSGGAVGIYKDEAVPPDTCPPVDGYRDFFWIEEQPHDAAGRATANANAANTASVDSSS
jgi:hypothetical protein